MLDPKKLEQDFAYLWLEGSTPKVELGAGWLPLAAQMLSLVATLNEAGIHARIVQVNEKLGAFTVYFRTLNVDELTLQQRSILQIVHDINNSNYKLSQHLCDVCGGFGQIVKINNILAARCGLHSEKRDYP